jgi:hypothetical protein
MLPASEERGMSLEIAKELVFAFALAGFVFHGFLIGRLRDRVAKLEAELEAELKKEA